MKFSFLLLLSIGCAVQDRAVSNGAVGHPFSPAIANLKIGMTWSQANLYLPDFTSASSTLVLTRREVIFSTAEEKLIVQFGPHVDGESPLIDWRVISNKLESELTFPKDPVFEPTGLRRIQTDNGAVLYQGIGFKKFSPEISDGWDFLIEMRTYSFWENMSGLQVGDLHNFVYNPRNYLKVAKWLKKKDRNEKAAVAFLKVNVPRLMEKGRVIR